MSCIESSDPFFSDNFQISSIIYSVYLDQEIDIEKTCNIFENCKAYERVRLNFRLKDPKATVCMSKSGYIRSMGTTSMAHARRAIHYAVEELSKQNVISNPQIVKERVENIVASGSFQYGLDLEYYAETLDNCIYEPEQFPGIIYRPNGKIVCLLFSSGAFVIVGAKSIEEIKSTYVTLRNTLNLGDM